MGRIFLIVCCCLAVMGLHAEKKITPQEFLALARRPNPVDTFAMLSGTLQHRREGSSAESMPIYFGIIIQKERSTGQLIFGDK